MKLLLSWLREHVAVQVEPRRLAEDLTLVGLAVDGFETLGKGDALLDIDVTTNRVDCMNVRGVAREVGTIYGLPLLPLDLSVAETGAPAAEALRVEIQAPDLCPRFCARVLDVRMGPGPAWMRDRLEAIGVRPISNVVDLTNYVMLELGQPSHAFDLALIPEGRLCVRWARDGEQLRTLDGASRVLTSRVGVVAGAREALGLAGIMGGASSEVGDGTRVVALEAAYWDPLSIRRAARGLGMHTEASHRFERGADPEGPVAATARIAHLLEKIGAGSARPGLIDVHAAKHPRRSAVLRPSRVERLLGASVSEGRGHEILRALGFGIGARESDGTRIEIPSWRGDVSREADLVEEVGRHFGLNRIGARIPPMDRAEGLRPWQARERRVREILVGAGLDEVILYAIVSHPSDAAGSVAIRNPLSEGQGVLRTSLVVPGLLGALRANLAQGRRDAGLFELGRSFRPADPLPREELGLGFVLSGAHRQGHWSEKARAADFFDAKGLLERLAERMGWSGLDFEAAADASRPAWLHPGQSAAIVRAGVTLGHVGALHPAEAARAELRDAVVVAELRIGELLGEEPAPLRVATLPRFPSVSRDLSVLCDAGLAAASLQLWARAAAGPRLRSIEVADRFSGPPVPAGRISVMLTLVYQDSERTLVGEEVQASVVAVAQALRAHGATIRGES